MKTVEQHIAALEAFVPGPDRRDTVARLNPIVEGMRDVAYALVVRSRGRLGWLARRLSRTETERPG